MFLFQCPYCGLGFSIESFDPDRSISCPRCGVGSVETPSDPLRFSSPPAMFDEQRQAEQSAWRYYESPSYDGPPLPPPGLSEAPKPYGIFSTIGIAFLLGLLLVAAQTAPIIAWALYKTNLRQPSEEFLLDLTQDAEMISVAAWSSAIVVVLGLWGVSAMKRGWSGLSYLGVSKFHPLQIPIWTIAYIGFFLFILLVVPRLPGPPPDESLNNMLAETTDYPLFVVSALVIAAPFMEELFFRGFLYRGLAASRLGPIGAILIASISWTLIHTNYSFPQLFTLFILGLLLGAARWKSNSIWPCIGLHAANNLLASLELLIMRSQL